MKLEWEKTITLPDIKQSNMTGVSLAFGILFLFYYLVGDRTPYFTLSLAAINFLIVFMDMYEMYRDRNSILIGYRRVWVNIKKGIMA